MVNICIVGTSTGPYAQMSVFDAATRYEKDDEFVLPNCVTIPLRDVQSVIDAMQATLNRLTMTDDQEADINDYRDDHRI